MSRREDPPRIIVYLEHEKYRDKVPGEMLGYRTEVIVVGKIKALSLLRLEEVGTLAYTYPGPADRTGRVRPLVGGISLGVPEDAYGGKMAGTLGLIVTGQDGGVYILTNAHVVAMDSKARFLPLGTAVLQPGTYGGGTLQDKVGELCKYIERERWVPEARITLTPL